MLRTERGLLGIPIRGCYKTKFTRQMQPHNNTNLLPMTFYCYYDPFLEKVSSSFFSFCCKWTLPPHKKSNLLPCFFRPDHRVTILDFCSNNMRNMQHSFRVGRWKVWQGNSLILSRWDHLSCIGGADPVKWTNTDVCLVTACKQVQFSVSNRLISELSSQACSRCKSHQTIRRNEESRGTNAFQDPSFCWSSLASVQFSVLRFGVESLLWIDR